MSDSAVTIKINTYKVSSYLKLIIKYYLGCNIQQFD